LSNVFPRFFTIQSLPEAFISSLIDNDTNTCAVSSHITLHLHHGGTSVSPGWIQIVTHHTLYT